MPDRLTVGKSKSWYDPVAKGYKVRPRPGDPVADVHIDFAEPQGGVFQAVGPATQLPAQEDAPICTSTGHRIKVIYATPEAWMQPPTQERVDLIRSLVRRMNWKIRQQSMVTSDNFRTLEMKVQCEADGQIKIHQIVSQTGVAAIDNTAKAQLGNPYNANAVRYLVFHSAPNSDVGGETICSCGTQSGSTIKSASDGSPGNPNRRFTSTAVIYSYDPITNWNWWSTNVVTHEFFHLMGATGYGAPFASPNSAHCTDGIDILCYEEPGSGYSETRCNGRNYGSPETVPIDCGADTYFDTRTEPGEWLTQHWNTGGAENPYLGESIIGPQSADVDLASSAPGRLDMVAPAPDNTLRYRSRSNGVWSPWANLGGILTSPPVVVSSDPGRLDVFARSDDASVVTISYVAGTGWSGWSSLGGIISSKVDAVSWGPGRIDVAVRGGGNAIYHTWKQGSGSWAPWSSFGGVFTSTPSLVARVPNELVVSAVGTDGALWARKWANNTWTDWQSLGGVLTSAPVSTVSRRLGHVGFVHGHIFARGTDNAAWAKYYGHSGEWLGWDPLGGAPITANTAPIAWGLLKLDLYARSDTGSIKVRRDVYSPASTWQDLGGSFETAPLQAASTADPSGGSALPHDVAAIGNDHKIYVGTYSTSGWSGWQVVDWPNDVVVTG
ncbi:MAG: hypothetical protein ABW167_05980 [Baekduia sp.]